MMEMVLTLKLTLLLLSSSTEELDGPSVSALRRAIVEVKQR
jgi:hypothetical protein